MVSITILSLINYNNLLAEVSQKCQKFEVTFTITYNAITLSEATRLEKVIRNDFSDACKVKTKLEETDDCLYFTADNVILDTITTPSTYSITDK